jgi:AcrR family transcriptional regulator
MRETLSRRDRARAATLAEIKDTARQLLVRDGVEGLSLRAIARDMGMTAPALYRYFASREELLADLIADLYDELSDAMEVARDAQPAGDVPARLQTVSREFRRWALAHPHEFGLLFGSPIEGVGDHGDPDHEETRLHQAGSRFGGVFAALLAQLYETRPFPVPRDEEIDPALREELAAWCGGFPVSMPVGVAAVLMSCWIRIYGLVCMEVFGHLKFAVSDAEPIFETELRDLARLLGVPDAYTPPTGTPATAAVR